MIKDSLKYHFIKEKNRADRNCFQSIKIKIGNIILVNVYNPPNNNLQDSDIEEVIKIRGDEEIIKMGDLNALHDIWGSIRNNRSGEKIMEVLDKYSYVVLNEPVSTRILKPGNNISPLDLIIDSQNILSYGN